MAAAEMTEEPRAQCRFCLMETLVVHLIAPCQCIGSVRYVHASCLRHWQLNMGKDDRGHKCQLCQTPFLIRPEAARCPPLFEMLRTSRDYDRNAASHISWSLRGRLLRAISAGSIVLQSQERAEACKKRQPDISPLEEAIVIAQHVHWNEAVYLLAGVFPGKAADGSDAIIGVNLAGIPFSSSRRPRIVKQLQDKLVNLPFAELQGGNVRPDRPLALVAVQCQLPIQTDPLVCFVRAVLDVDILSVAASNTGFSTSGDCSCSGALFGEPEDVLRLLDAQRELQLVGGTIFYGHVVWSSEQLLSELVLASWDLSRARAIDLTNPLRLGNLPGSLWRHMMTNYNVQHMRQLLRSESKTSTLVSPPVYEHLSPLPKSGCGVTCTLS